MKTVEEKENEIYSPSDSSFDVVPYISKFRQGVEFAQRWIPITEEPIPLHQQILVKCENGNIYDVVKLPSLGLNHWWGNHDEKVIEQNVTSWRLITVG